MVIMNRTSCAAMLLGVRNLDKEFRRKTDGRRHFRY